MKKIENISEESQIVLSYASVLGKEIDLQFLSDLTNISQESLSNALEDGIENHFLVRDIMGTENISFVHDKIREAFYTRLPVGERISLHGQIGYLLEAQNKNNLKPFLYDLVHHFSRAKIEEKTLLYSLQAAKKAQSTFAHDQAIRLYEEVRKILDRQGKSMSPEYIDILQNLGLVYRWAGKPDKSLATLKKCKSLIQLENKLGMANVLCMMGDTL